MLHTIIHRCINKDVIFNPTLVKTPLFESISVVRSLATSWLFRQLIVVGVLHLFQFISVVVVEDAGVNPLRAIVLRRVDSLFLHLRYFGIPALEVVGVFRRLLPCRLYALIFRCRTRLQDARLQLRTIPIHK